MVVVVFVKLFSETDTHFRDVIIKAFFNVGESTHPFELASLSKKALKDKKRTFPSFCVVWYLQFRKCCLLGTHHQLLQPTLATLQKMLKWVKEDLMEKNNLNNYSPLEFSITEPYSN